MLDTIHFAYPWVIYSGLSAITLSVIYRIYYRKKIIYQFPLTHAFENNFSIFNRSLFMDVIRTCVLIALTLLIARPQRIDEQSKITIEGIDIMLVLDVSNSMQCFDDPRNEKTRLKIAQEEAVNFLKKRENDPIGIVLFGNQSVSRCPVTLDKHVLENIINTYELGEVDGTGTVLNQAIATAINRLRKSQAKSKIIIMLTDGMPSENDIPVEYALELAQKYNIKIYTIGIGSKNGGYIRHPYTGSIVQAGATFNEKLLEVIAQKTGGKAFVATNQKDLNTIYNTIDALEKKEYETDVYKKYYDIFMPYLKIIWGVMIVEFLLYNLMWSIL